MADAFRPQFADVLRTAARHAVEAMRILVTGVSGFVGSRLVGRLARDGHELRGLARDPARVTAPVPVVRGDAATGAGLARALAGVEVAYYLIHSMEPPPPGAPVAPLVAREREAAERFAAAAVAAGVRRIVYLGGLAPTAAPPSEHLASRLAVERTLLAALPDALALRASIVIGARSRSFRFLVRLIERLPVIALPPWRDHRTQPIDERDVIELLARAAAVDGRAVADATAGERSLDIAGPDVVTYRALIERIRDHLLLDRPLVPLDGPIPGDLTSRLAAAIAGEQHALVGPLMDGLDSDLLARDDRAADLLGVRRHGLDAAIEHALADWERDEPLAAR